MRGKRFKAAVQAAFGQRGWTKDDDETWKGVAHLVGMSEEDEEESWALILSRGPPPGESRVRPDRRQEGRGHQQPQPANAGGQTVQPDWTAVLNLHGKPRGSVTPEELQQIQRPTTDTRPSTRSTAAAGEPPGDPRRRRQAAENSTQQQQDEEDPLMWDGLFSTMIISAGGASRPITFPPEIPSTWGVDIHEACHTEHGQA